MPIETTYKSLFLIFTLLMLNSLCAAQTWGPEQVEISCKKEPCLPPEKREQLESYAVEILKKFRAMGFNPPQKTTTGNRIGDFIPGRSNTPVIQIHYDPEKTKGFASAYPPCNEQRGFIERPGRITLGPKVSTFPPHLIYWFMAHEIFHTIQFSQPVFLQAQKCGFPLWLGEGTANAVGIKLMQEHFGENGFNPPLTVPAGPHTYGLRPYYIGFTADAGASLFQHVPDHKSLSYKTNSFWRYIADRYYAGKMNYLATWMKNPMANENDDWLRWVDQQLLTDKNIKTKMYMVFPDFQANFSTWAPNKYSHLNSEEWLKIAYNNCLEVNLSSAHPSKTINLDMEPISARCIRVSANGISPGNVASIKIMAEDEDTQNLDNLHLSGAILSAKVRSRGSDFNCYRDAKSAGHLPACLDKPFTGKHHSLYRLNSTQTRMVKTWLNEPQIPENGVVDNRYVISHTPLNPRDSRHNNRKIQKVKLTIGLDLTNLSTSSTGKAKRASSIINLKAGFPVPMRGSEDPTQIASKDKASKAAYHISKNSTANMRITDKGILSISITDRDLESDPEEQLEGGLSFTINPYDLLIPFGATGKFPAKLTSGFEMKDIMSPSSIIVMVPEEQVMGSIFVHEFSDQLLHLELLGNFCRIGNLNKKTGKCNKVETVKGTIIKPFGWAYDGGQDFVSIDSPGMAEYRRILSTGISMYNSMPFQMPVIQGMPQNLMNIGDNSGSGIPDCVQLPEDISKTGYSTDVTFCSVQKESTAANSTSETFTLTDPAAANCSCSCTEMKEVSSLSDQITNVPETADGRPDMTALKLEKLTCIFQCAKEYATCR